MRRFVIKFAHGPAHSVGSPDANQIPMEDPQP